ncbi:MAG TPA: hypothetical protein VH762_08230 [Gemmatimonadaceae bacterium]
MSKTMRMLLTVAVVAGSVSMSACGGARQGPRGTDPPTMLQVDNQRFLDMNIYLITSGGARIRLGTATGNSSTTMRIPATYVFGGTDLRFLADPIGAQSTPVSQSITVFPGDNVKLIIPP